MGTYSGMVVYRKLYRGYVVFLLKSYLETSFAWSRFISCRRNIMENIIYLGQRHVPWIVSLARFKPKGFAE